MRYSSIPLICLFLFSQNCLAQGNECFLTGKESKVANVAKYGLPSTALALAVYKRDWWGAALSQGLAYGLYYGSSVVAKKIDKKRPCGCTGSFPSGHGVAMASGASFLHYRYGWQYGLPAYLFALAGAADRVRIKAHSVLDMAGSFAIANLVTYVVTSKFTKDVEYIPAGWLTNEDPQAQAHEMMIKRDLNKPYWMPDFRFTSDEITFGLRLRF